MKIIPKITVESAKGGKKVTYPAGEECNLPDNQAQDLVSRGFAAPVGKSAPPATPDSGDPQQPSMLPDDPSQLQPQQ